MSLQIWANVRRGDFTLDKLDEQAHWEAHLVGPPLLFSP